MADWMTAKKIIWWLTWGLLIGCLALLPSLLRIPLSESGLSLRLTVYIAAPLIGATVIRWFILQKIGSTILGFVLFLVGLILANMSGLMALFLMPAYRTDLYYLCLLGIFQFIPQPILGKQTAKVGAI